MRAIPVRFDDRLQTVLRQPSAHAHDVAVRWRQLVDLVARAGPESEPAAIAEAIAVIHRDRDDVDEATRSAAARAVASLPLPRALLASFLTDRLSVSAPVLAAARLSRDDWEDLLHDSPAEVARFVAAVHPEAAPMNASGEVAPQALAHSSQQIASPSPLRHAHAPPQPTRTIGEVIERIERRRDRRLLAAPPTDDGSAAIFRFECEPSGEIDWVDGAPRGALVGRSLLRGGQGNIGKSAREAFAKRAPFHDAAAVFAGDGVIGGEWRLSAVPAFDPAGHFEGYRGVAVRPGATALVERSLGDSGHILPDPVMLRELVHELRTPINAIVGFGEIIDGQFLGPAGLEYRQRAGAIVAEARYLLEAIADLDLLASATVASGRSPVRARTDLAAALAEGLAATRASANARHIEFLANPSHEIAVAMPEAVAVRMATRFLETIIELSADGERLRLAIEPRGQNAALIADKPRDGQGEDGMAFALRLMRGLARLSGGDLTLTHASVILILPLV